MENNELNTNNIRKKVIVKAVCFVAVAGIVGIASLVMFKKTDDNSKTTANNTQLQLTNNIAASEQTQGNTNQTDSKVNLDKITISDENLVRAVIELKDFSDVKELSTEDYLMCIYMALNDGYIEIEKKTENDTYVEYTEKAINSLVYSIFGIELKDNQSVGTSFEYKDGIYKFTYSDRGAVNPEIRNMKTNVKDGIKYITCDYYNVGSYLENGEEYKGRYIIRISEQDGCVLSKKIEENQDNSENLEENNTISWTGKYVNEDEGENYYHSANVKFSNQTQSTIDFDLSAVHGRDVEHVNMGEVNGTAKLINSKTNQEDGETEYDTYLFEEKIDGKEYKITFVFNAHRRFKWVDIKEDFADDINPYAGNNVSFAGEYETKAE